MAAEIINDDELLAAMARAGVKGFLPESRAKAIKSAVSRVRNAALNDYTAESFELLTPANAPEEMREYTVALALHSLTKGDAGRASSIGEAYADAKAWLGFMAAGKTHYHNEPDGVLVKNTRASEDELVDYQAPPKKFNRAENDYYGVPRRRS